MNFKALLARLHSNKISLFICLTLYLCIEFIALGPFSYFELNDTIDYWFTRYPVISNNFLKFGLTNWHPNIACGIDRISNDMLHPNITATLFSFLPGWLAYQIIVVTQIFIAGFFSYKLCRDSLKLNPIASIFGGVYYAVFCVDLFSMRFALSGVPFAIWALEKISKKQTRNPLFKTILLGILFGAGLSLVRIPFFLTVILSWFVIIKNERQFKIYGLWILFSGIVSAWHTFDFYGMLSNAPFGQRATMPPEVLSMDIFSILEHFIYMPLVPLLLIIMVCFKKTKHTAWNFFLLLGIYFAGSILIGILETSLINNLGTFKGFNFNRYVYYQAFFATFAAACCFDYLYLKKFKWLKILLILSFSALFIQSLIFKKDHALVWIEARNYIGHFKSDVIQSLNEEKDSSLFRVTTFSRGMIPDTVHTFGLESVDGVASLYPQRYKLFWSKVIEPLTQKDNPVDLYFNDYGYRIYLFAPSNPEINKIKFDEYYRLNLLSLANTRYIISRIPIEDGRLTPVFEQEKSWADLSNKEKIKINLKSNFKGNSYLYVYENKSYFPRFFLTPSVKTFDSLDALYDQLGKASLKDLRTYAYLERKHSQTKFKNLNAFQTSDIIINHYSPDHIDLTVQLDGDGIFVATQNYTPFWVCTVDGQEREIFPVYGPFSGIFLNKGNHHIVFEYKPPYKLRH